MDAIHTKRERERLLAEVKRLRAERDALARAYEAINDAACGYLELQDTASLDELVTTLDEPIPAHAERVRLMRAVVEAARGVAEKHTFEDGVDVVCGKEAGHSETCWIAPLLGTIAALDAHEKEQADG